MVPGAPLGVHYSPRELARYQGRLMSQGPSSDLMNRVFEISRAELDAYSAQSHDRAFAASCAGKFAGQLVPITSDSQRPGAALIQFDEGIRSTSTATRLLGCGPRSPRTAPPPPPTRRN